MVWGDLIDLGLIQANNLSGRQQLDRHIVWIKQNTETSNMTQEGYTLYTTKEGRGSLLTNKITMHVQENTIQRSQRNTNSGEECYGATYGWGRQRDVHSLLI